MPFGDYKDMADCISKNSDKGDAGAYCASIHKKITGEWPGKKKESFREKLSRLSEASKRPEDKKASDEHPAEIIEQNAQDLADKLLQGQNDLYKVKEGYGEETDFVNALQAGDMKKAAGIVASKKIPEARMRQLAKDNLYDKVVALALNKAYGFPYEEKLREAAEDTVTYGGSGAGGQTFHFKIKQTAAQSSYGKARTLNVIVHAKPGMTKDDAKKLVDEKGTFVEGVVDDLKACGKWWDSLSPIKKADVIKKTFNGHVALGTDILSQDKFTDIPIGLQGPLSNYWGYTVMHRRESVFHETTNSQWYSKITDTPLSKVRAKFGTQADKLMQVDADIWDSLGAESGNDIEKKWDEYKKLVKQKIPQGLNPYLYLLFEDNNYHSLNKALDENSQWGTLKLMEGFREKLSRLSEGRKREGSWYKESSESDELLLYIENDGDLYRQQYIPIIKNLMLKRSQGVYNSTGAVKAFEYLVTNGAKKYSKDFSTGSDWNTMFSPSDREAVARELAKRFERDADAGEWNQYIPKKYQNKLEAVRESFTEAFKKDELKTALNAKGFKFVQAYNNKNSRGGNFSYYMKWKPLAGLDFGGQYDTEGNLYGSITYGTTRGGLEKVDSQRSDLVDFLANAFKKIMDTEGSQYERVRTEDVSDADRKKSVDYSIKKKLSDPTYTTHGKYERLHKERTNDSPPAFDVGGWILYDTSPLEIGAAKAMVDKLKKSDRYTDAKLSGSLKDPEDGKTYSYIRVKKESANTTIDDTSGKARIKGWRQTIDNLRVEKVDPKTDTLKKKIARGEVDVVDDKDFDREAFDGEKHGYICMTCGKTIHGGVNEDGECPKCAARQEQLTDVSDDMLPMQAFSQDDHKPGVAYYGEAAEKTFDVSDEKGLKDAEKYQQKLYALYDKVFVKPAGTDKITVYGEAAYPWDSCISDQKAKGYSDERAAKICGAIKAGNVKHSLDFRGKMEKLHEAYGVYGKKPKDEQYSVLTVGDDLWYFDTLPEAQKYVKGFPKGTYEIHAPKSKGGGTVQ